MAYLSHKFKRRGILAGAVLSVGITMSACHNASESEDNSAQALTSPAPSSEHTTTQADTSAHSPAPTPAQITHLRHIASLASQSLATAAAFGAKSRLSYAGLPKNTRQVPEGYWLGARPNVRHIDELHARQVKLIVTAASIPSDEFRAIKARLEQLNMAHIHIPFGGKFPNPQRFYAEIQHYAPEQVYIHCEHGGDRSGALLAFMLVTQHNWSVPRALLAVAFPGRKDSQALIDILRSRGYEINQEDIDNALGIYSAENNGGFGGLKVRSQGYVRLVHTTIDATHRVAQNP
ncbi:MAG: hypothetical protein FWC40_01600 [Proteobacteria bacterium]|nr:hypothetical protein [Pseudomonadota bacterium]